MEYKHPNKKANITFQEENTSKNHLINNYHAFEIKLRNTKEKECSYLPLQMNDAIKLFNEDKNEAYVTENNKEFLEETGAIKSLQYNDEYLRPYMVSNCNYDVMLGSEGVKTPLRYEINYRTFFIVTQGSVKIKLTPPKNSKYLEATSDYENFEFRSTVNPWTYDSQAKYKFMEVELTIGKTIYIPAYWWYSIEFHKESSITCCRYRTYMNNVAIIPNVFMYALQNQNIKLDIMKNMLNGDAKTNEKEKEIVKDDVIIESSSTEIEK
jgi:hypothetical protein